MDFLSHVVVLLYVVGIGYRGGGGDVNIGVLVVDNDDYSNVLHLTAICPVQ